MLTSLLAIPLGLLLISTSVLSEITISLNYDHDLKDSLGKKYEIRGNINLHCKVTSNEKDLKVVWKKEDKDVPSLSELKDRYTENSEGNSYGFKISKAVEDDAGTYHCIVSRKGEELKRANITLFSRYRVKTPDNVNVVEGEVFRIHCVVYGKPTPTISWRYENNTYTESTERVELKKDVERDVDNAIFEIKEVTMGDRGVYTCSGVPEVGETVEHSTMVRIKDKYAALWPFLGICAEVFILCAIILIYEKKRNKTELEESDTDQSPDQKNTPDHGKESNLRHRQ